MQKVNSLKFQNSVLYISNNSVDIKIVEVRQDTVIRFSIQPTIYKLEVCTGPGLAHTRDGKMKKDFQQAGLRVKDNFFNGPGREG